MTNDEVKLELVAMLKEYQSKRPDADAGEVIDGSTRPVLDLCHFDSLCGVEMTVVCFARFGIEDDNSTQSVFVDGNRALTVSEIAERILDALPKMEKPI